ncbi:MAG: phosphate-binding protein [Chlorobiaceae bacterium]|nr:phosphate-binding protein [Chlorobiaceae bacterium]
MNHRFRNVVIVVILAAGIMVPLLLWVRPMLPERAKSLTMPRSTPVSGTLTIAVERSLLEAAGEQSRHFCDAYPSASLSFSSSTSTPLIQLLRRQAGGVLVEGRLTNREDSVMTALQRPVKRQPVARSALVLVVNQANAIPSLSVQQLQAIFSGKATDWKSVGGQPGSIVACVDGSDQRLHSLLSEMLFGKADALSASAEPDLPRLLKRVREDRNALVVMTLPAWAEASRSGDSAGLVRALPVSADKGSSPVEASPETLYSRAYPLSVIVYYLYDPYDPLATGFGAWLAKEGQKLFERADMAPYEQLVRTIILK